MQIPDCYRSYREQRKPMLAPEPDGALPRFSVNAPTSAPLSQAPPRRKPAMVAKPPRYHWSLVVRVLPQMPSPDVEHACHPATALLTIG